MKEGGNVLVPRTGGGFSPGTILMINPNNGKALVEFAIGDTFQGRPAPEEIKNGTGTKVVDISKLRPLGVNA